MEVAEAGTRPEYRSEATERESHWDLKIDTFQFFKEKLTHLKHKMNSLLKFVFLLY